ncbi:MAG: peptidase C39 [Lachnospiraceae bacterium]|nr:peptidase C39 [Lachnospiraceae bacterium]
MKNLLNYQTSEYDCGPVSLLNGIRYLFEREEIAPDLVKFIMLYCMDSYNEAGELCKHGTSAAAMNYMASWMNHFGEVKKFPLACEFFTGKEVVITPESRITHALKKGGVVVVHVFLEVPHYVLLTGIKDDRVLLFDPFYEEIDDPELDEEYSTDEIEFLLDTPKKANRSVSIERMNRTTMDYYEMGDYSCREALIMYNTAQIRQETK